MNDMNTIDFYNKTSFNGIKAESLSCLVKSYITRTFDEDLFCLLKFFPLEKDFVACLCSKLGTSKTTGISKESEAQRQLRENVFSTNAMPYRQPTSFISLLYNASKDFVLRILMLSGLVSLLLSFISDEDRRVEFIDGAAIFLTVLIVLLVSACNDYFKEKQFAALSDRSEKFCTIIRNSETYKINIEEILVGDVLFVEVGDEIPVDGLVLQAEELQLDESSITGESDAIQKCTLEECLKCAQNMKDLDKTGNDETGNRHHLVPSPIVLSGSIVMDGSGLLLVLAVGSYSQGGQVMNKLVVDTAPTSLQNKLNTLARDIGTVGFIAAVITLLVYMIQFWVHYKVDDDFSKSLSFKSILDRHIKFLVQAITILVVAVPEGLPLAVTLSLAYSVRRMLQDQNYVRRLASCEIMGSASEILLDKTGTLTMNRMTVEFIWSYALAKSTLKDAKEFLKEMEPLLSEKHVLQSGKNIVNSFPFILIHSIALNSTANLEITQVKIPNGTETEHIKTLGSPTESALLLLLRDMKCDYNTIRKEYGNETKIKHRVPFSSSRKIMTTVVTHPENPSLYRVYVKGGAELVLKLCQFLLESNGNIKSMTPPVRNGIERQVIQNMTCRGLRAVCLAYKDVDPSLHKFCFETFTLNNAQFHFRASQKSSTLTVDDALKQTDRLKDDRFVLEKGLVCLSVIGIRDMVREEVPAAVRLCQQAGVRVRMVTGDNIETAKQIAIKCHIYHPEQGGIALTGSEFYRRIGGVICKQCRTEVCDCPLTEVSTLKNKSGEKKRKLQFRRETSLKNDVNISKVVEESKKSSNLGLVSGNSNKSMKEIVLRIGTSSNIENEKNVKKNNNILSRMYCVCKKYFTPFEKKVTVKKTEPVIRVDEIGNLPEFEAIANNLEVLARSQPQDKYAMVLGLKAMNCIVAVTGDGINDAPALKKADVGFAMGITGKEVAKQAADIVILDDNFESIVKAIKWGRSIYNNVRKFLLFQLTVNITAVSTAFIGSVLVGESPLTAVQLLWVNLIMDSFASLALGTEQATDDLLYKPHSSNEYLINRVMTRNIIGQIVYQLGVMFLLIFTGECWIPEQVSSYSQFEGKDNFSQFSKLCGNGRTVAPGRSFFFFSQKELYKRSWVQSIGPSRHYTIVFNTFVFLQVANLWNARKIDNEWNVFSGAFSSWLWWIVLGIISVTQTLLIHFGGQALRCHKDGLTAIQWLICLSFALGGLLVGFLLHFIPAEELTFIPQAGKKETDILAKSTNVALASRGRFSSTRLSSRLAAGLHNESSHVYKTNRFKMMQSHRSSSSLTVSPKISTMQSSLHF